jgi:Uncharacterised protein family (UPF0164)
MRRRRSNTAVRRVAFACAFVASGAVTGPLPGQGGLAKEGALFLLLPVGARSVGMGGAVVAGEPGSEGIWANPASLARLERRELAINHSTSIAGSLDALVFVLPEGRAGVLSVAAYIFNPGRQDNTDMFGTVIGGSYPKDLVFAASYGATFGSRVRAGITYKFLQDRTDCTGDCVGIPVHVASTHAFDVGIQGSVDNAGRFTIGAALRSAGLRLQVNDVEQADPLPARVHLGAQYVVPSIERAVEGGELRLATELASRLSFDQSSLRAGAEFAYRKQFFLRAGFASGNDPAAGVSIGLGLQRGGISVDFARSTGGLSSDAGIPPTYVTLRFRF